MILTGQEILKRKANGQISIEPWVSENLNPGSVNLRLHPEMEVYTLEDYSVEAEVAHGLFSQAYLDSGKKNRTKKIVIPEDGYVLQPGELYIARTVEYTETWGLVPQLVGRSSLARLGLTAEISAGYGETGFCGTWTLEITVVHPLKVYPNMKICQIYYNEVIGEVDNYNGKYLGQVDATPSKLFTEM